MDKKLKVAVIGLGRISKRHLNAYKTENLAEIVAVCDIKKDRADSHYSQRFPRSSSSSVCFLLQNLYSDCR